MLAGTAPTAVDLVAVERVKRRFFRRHPAL